MLRLLAADNGFVHACGHRGHSIGAPENTLAALTATRDKGGTSAEIDVRLTADGEIILFHDDFLDRTTNGSGLASASTFDELRRLDAGSWFDAGFAGERIPLLAEAADHAARIGIGLVIELKEERQIDRMVAGLERFLGSSDLAANAVFISFDHAFLKSLKQLLPGIRTEGILHARHVDVVDIARAADLDSLSIERAMFRPEDGAALHDAGIAVRVHIPVPAVFERYATAGADLLPELIGWIAAGTIDTVSGDDVGFIAALTGGAAGGGGRPAA